MTADRLTLKQLNRATLARQMLLERERVGVVEAVERLAALQGQEAKPPFIGLWTRLEGFKSEDLHTALHKRRLVRATLMRATLHLMSARDYAATRMALAPALDNAMGSRTALTKGLEPEKVLPAARKLLKGHPRGFNELRELLAEQFPKANDRALGYSVRTRLPLVMVPTDDRWGFPSVSDFALADEWLEEPLSKSEDPRRLVLRYLAALGPATVADAQSWTGLKGLKAVVEDLRPELAVFRDDRGRELFDLPDAPRPDADVPAPPRFLPEFDNLVLSHADRTRVLADEHRGKVTTKNLRVRATFLWDGIVRGTWSVERKKENATLHMAPFEALPTRALKELEGEGEAVLRFCEEDAGSFDVQVDKPS